VSVGGAGLPSLSVSAGTDLAGPGHGICLFAAGGLAGLSITGDGFTPGSGGTIRNTNFEAVYLVDTVNVDLNCLNVQDTGFDMAGIYAAGVNGFFLDRVNISDTGCDGLQFASSVSGDVTIGRTTVSGAMMSGLYAGLEFGAADWTIRDCTFANSGGDALDFLGAINGSVSIINTTVTGSYMAGLYAYLSSGTADWTISG